jgi:transcriptional regulator with XRE-family HTH domain
MPVTEREPTDAPSSYSAVLRTLRVQTAKSETEVATAAKLSTRYYVSLENGKHPPPPRRTAVRLARALGLTGRGADALVALAVIQRNHPRHDEALPADVASLLCELRTHAFKLPRRFVQALRVKLREAIKDTRKNIDFLP